MFCSTLSLQKQYHTQIDELIEESVKDMIQLMVAKVWLYSNCENDSVMYYIMW